MHNLTQLICGNFVQNLRKDVGKKCAHSSPLFTTRRQLSEYTWIIARLSLTESTHLSTLISTARTALLTLLHSQLSPLSTVPIIITTNSFKKG